MSDFLCDCGCKLFHDFRPYTIDESSFMIWSLKETLRTNKITIPIMECVSCGRLHSPRASFAGKNILDDEVKLYSDLLNYIKHRNSMIDTLIRKIPDIQVSIKLLEKDLLELKDVTIKAAHASKENSENAVDTSKARSGSKPSNKK